MNPDREHETYFRKNPKGNHNTMSDETARELHKLRADIMNKIDDELKEIHQFHLGSVKNDTTVLEQLKAINKQLVIMNGRIGKNEERGLNNEKTNEMLTANFNRVYEEYHSHRIATKNSIERWREWMVRGIVGTLLLIVGALVLLVLERTKVIDLSERSSDTAQVDIAQVVEELRNLELVEQYD